MADIAAVIRSLQDGMVRGRRTPRDDVFERVTVKFGYVIPYTIKNNEVFVLRVYDSRQRGIDYAAQSREGSLTAGGGIVR